MLINCISRHFLCCLFAAIMTILSGCDTKKVKQLEAQIEQKESQLEDVRNHLSTLESKFDDVKSYFVDLKSEVDNFDYYDWERVMPDLVLTNAANDIESAISDLESEIDSTKSAVN